MDMENAACSENPNIVPEKKRKKRKKRKISSDVCNDNPMETTMVKDIPLEPPVNKSTELVPPKAEDKTVEPPVNKSTELVPPKAEDKTVEPPVTRRRKKKKKKKKKNDAEINTVVNGSEDGASSKSTLIESSCLESVDSINSATSSDRPILNTNLSCSKKKKKIKKRKRNHVVEVAGSNATELEENSLTPVQQSDFSNTANTSSLEKHEDNAQIDHVSLGLRNSIMYKRKRSVKICPGNGHLVKKDGTNSTSAYCPGDTNITSLETKPVGVNGVSSPVVEDIMTEKVSANCPDVSMRDLEKGNCGDTSEGNLRKKNGAKLHNIHISSADVSHVDEDSGCKDNSSDNLSRGDLLNKPLELELQKGPSDTGVVEDGTDLNPSMKEGELSLVGFSPERALVAPSRKKLLILDVNGLLVEFVPYVPDKYKPDTTISRKSVFKRPYCDEFLQFCFDKFNVGIWSSRTKKNIDLVVNFLMGDSRNKLMFCWDQSRCTTTGLYTIENSNKPLVLKELKKLWDKLEPDLPWEKGDYNETNTLLLDDSPYKALRNPVYTAIFPDSYHYRDRNDNSLGPGGDLRTYLEGLVVAENVQKYVKENPFGQRAITEAAPTWSFYSQILEPET